MEENRQVINLGGALGQALVIDRGWEKREKSGFDLKLPTWAIGWMVCHELRESGEMWVWRGEGEFRF